MYDKANKFLSKIMADLKRAFPYFSPNDTEGAIHFCSAHVGSSDQHNILIRINFEYHRFNEPEKVTYGVVDDNKKQFLFGDIEGLRTKVSEIIKGRIDEEIKQRKDAMKADMESMLLCGFLTKNNLSYSTEKHDSYVIVNIFGTAFEKLSIYIYKKDPNVYKIKIPSASFNQSQLEKFILTCKSLKE